MTAGIDLGKFGAQKDDQGGIVDPHEDDHQRTGGAVGRSHALAGQVEADKDIAELNNKAVTKAPRQA